MIKSRPSSLFSLLLLLALCARPGSLPAAVLATGVDYSSGKYGGDTTSTSLSVPLDVTWTHGRFDAGFGIAWLRISGAGTAIPGLGPVRRVTLPAGPTGRRPRFPVPASDTTATGLGDFSLHGAWTPPLGESDLRLRLAAACKLGTADETKGLGSGETDYAVDADLSGTAGVFDWSLGLGYQVLGEPDGVALDNGFKGRASLSVPTARAGTWSVAYDRTASTNAGVPAAAALNLSWSKALPARTALSLYVGAGLSDASPEWSAGLSLQFTLD
ncbi:MAG: hypothetical protein HY302_09530 [Opitutae bacterium]|nr:hypothetical protein [Opitutae bacterium]